MKLPIDKALRDHLNKQRLDAGQLSALRALQDPGLAQQPEKRSKQPFWIASAAVLLAAVLSLGLLLEFSGQGDLIDEIATEVVYNHLHMKPLEVNTPRIASIQDYFTGLDFKPVESRYVADQRLAMLGGRYCSLRGVTAAQLRFKSPVEDGVRTLYQVGYDPEIFRALPDYDRGDAPVSTWAKGIKVTLWVEKGVLFALTEDPQG